MPNKGGNAAPQTNWFNNSSPRLFPAMFSMVSTREKVHRFGVNAPVARRENGFARGA